MNKNLTPIQKKINSASKKSKLEDIQPYTERPSADRMDPAHNENDALGAVDLFSQFTANIIRENTVFTR